MKREEKKRRPYARTSSYQKYANSAFLLLLFQYSNPSFPNISHYPLQIFWHLRKKISRSADYIVVFYLLLFFLIFVCIKGYPSSDSGPSKENFMKRVQIQDDEEAKCQRWWRARKQAIAWASCVRVVFISRIFIHTVRKGHGLLKQSMRTQS